MSPAAKQFDWDRLRSQLARVGSAVSAADGHTADQAAAILAERARRLAHVPPVPLPSDELLDIVTFRLGGEHYGVESRSVREVLRNAPQTRLPQTGSLLISLANLRGQVLPVFDIREILGAAPDNSVTSEWLLVVGEEEDGLGLRVDDVQEVVRVRIRELIPVSGNASESRGLIRGVTSRALIVLDDAALLQEARLFINHSEPVR